jgi:hypothetical protein
MIVAHITRMITTKRRQTQVQGSGRKDLDRGTGAKELVMNLLKCALGVRRLMRGKGAIG